MSKGASADRTSGAREPTVRIFDGPDEVCRAAREELIQTARAAIAERARFSVALSGGSTPRRLYASLVDAKLPWGMVHVFFGDERHVSPDHPDSNFRMARESLLSKIAIPRANVHRIQAEIGDAENAAREYEAELRRSFELRPGELPRLDLVLLGLGADGHTASLFPGTSALKEETHLVAATWVEKLAAQRITLTISVINNAARVIFLVCGEDKARVLRSVLSNDSAGSGSPARRIRPTDGELVWLVDRAAAQP